MSDGFTKVLDSVLLAIRANLLRGLDQVAASIDAGTFHEVGSKGSAPASQAGQVTRIFLAQVDTELARRRGDS